MLRVWVQFNIIYILCCLSFVFISIYLCADKKLNFGVSLTISFIIWIGLNCLTCFVILPSWCEFIE